MSEEEKPTALDRAVELLAGLMDALGLNGTRLRWKWRQKRQRLGETGVRTEVLWRSAKGRHKMCPSCRALVPRSASTCSECGAGLAAVRAPGIGRMLTNVLPGATATTSLLLLVNGVLFMLMLTDSLRGEQSVGIFAPFPIPIFLKYGAVFDAAVFDYGAWWRLATAMFLHGGLLHFAFNSYALLNLGPIVEAEFGTERFWFVYLCAGVAGNLLHIVLAPLSPVVGASGAICGLVGLLVAYGSRVRTGAAAALKQAMIRFSFLILIISLLPGVSWQAHLGGFATGFGLGWVVPTGRFRGRRDETLWQVLSLAGVLAVLYAFYKVAMEG